MKPIKTFNDFKPNLIPKSRLYNTDLNSAIALAKYVFVGEIHGAKENCDVLYSLIRHYKVKNLALELDIELKPFVDSCIAGKPHLEKLMPTSWVEHKTEAIDFTKPFLWFDDDCYLGERLDLEKNNAFNSWVEVDLRNYPDQLQREIKLLETFVEESG